MSKEFKRVFCLTEPCAVNVDFMNRNNIEMKWKYAGQILHGDMVDFACKQGYDLSPSTPLSELSVQCNRGEVKYPVCIRKGKMIVLSDNFSVDQCSHLGLSIRP